MGFLTFQDCVDIFNNGDIPEETSLKALYNLYKEIEKNANTVEDVFIIRENREFFSNFDFRLKVQKKYDMYLYNQKFIKALKDEI